MRALIVAGGQVDDELVCDLIKQGGYEVIVAADSGMEVLYRHHLTPDIVVGDFDSVDYEALSYFRESDSIEFVELNVEKDDTDTEHALRDAISRGACDITIVGCTGTRIDHMLGNISLLGIGLEAGVDIVMLDVHNRIRMIDAPLTIKKQEQYGNYVSVIPVKNAHNVSLEGFKYSLSNFDMSGFNTLGISNEICAEEALISFTEGVLLVIEAKD